MNQIMKQGMIEVMKNLRQRVRDQNISKTMAYPDWKAVHAEWDLETTPDYHLTISQFLELTQRK